ncbi:MAG: hypothetical protein ACJ8GN_10085 [Longimicrobiaceae bacterium]
MTPLRPTGRRGRSLAAALVLAAALAAGACGRKQVPAEEYDPDAPKAPPAVPPPAAQAGPPAAPGAAPAPMPTPEQDSAQEAAFYARRQQSMESYESCVAKVRDVEEPARSTLVAACARTRAGRAKR